MSVVITKPISGIVIEGQEIDLRPKEPLAGTYEAPTSMNVEILIENAPVAERGVSVRGKRISGRVWAEPEERTSNKLTKHKPDEREKVYRRARTLQLREFLKVRKAEIEEKVTRAKEQRKDAKKKKERNQLKGQTYQVIKDTKKLKKWSKKARKQLMKMPKDMFEEHLKTMKQRHDEENA